MGARDFGGNVEPNPRPCWQPCSANR